MTELEKLREDCLNCRMTSELDQAYLVGYQTAIRLLLQAQRQA